MGLSASQARFLQLTARKSNVEYQAQRITFERIQLATKTADASTAYNDKMSNRKMVFSFNNGEGTQQVDLTYQNYKLYMNQQKEDLTTSHEKYYLVSTSGNKLVVSSEAERDAMIEANTVYTKISPDDNTDGKDTIIRTDEEGVTGNYLVNRQFNENDFIIADDLDDTDNFQSAIKDGIYYFAQRALNDETGEMEFRTQSWDSIGTGAISETYDTADDAVAEAEYNALLDKLQSKDKKLELQLDQLETERNALDTELESVKSVIEKNIEKSFTSFG